MADNKAIKAYASCDHERALLVLGNIVLVRITRAPRAQVFLQMLVMC